MRNVTRALFNAYLANVAVLNEVAAATDKFNVAPVVQQRLEQRLQESSEFLKLINIVPIIEQSGDVLGLDAYPNASRTNTAAGNRRQPKDVTSISLVNQYFCYKTDYDTSIPYAKLDAWAGHTDFEIKIRDLIIKSQALARIMIGFNGTHAAVETDRAKYPLLEDVNIGWLQKYRDNAPQNVLSSGKQAGVITIGPGGDYNNLDALVYDTVNNLIDPIYRDDTSLRAMIGRGLTNSRQFPLINGNNVPTEILAVNTILGLDKVSGVQSMNVPYLAENAIFIQPLANLSIYYQESARRRMVKDEPEYDRVANYESSNDAFVVENYEAGCLIENIQFVV